MKLDRNIRGSGGKGKYALVRLRTVQAGDEAHKHLKALEALGVLDWGVVGDPDEFFVIKLKDKYAPDAIRAYAEAVAKDAQTETEEPLFQDKMQWSIEITKLGERAGTLSPFCKEPD